LFVEIFSGRALATRVRWVELETLWRS